MSPASTSDELRARIPGWGVDLDPADRPSTPKLLAGGVASTYGDVAQRQPETQPRERSVEHAHLTPVFGTAQPLHGLSGVLRRVSYARFSEARAAHWLLLIAADRVDAVEGHVAALLALRPDDPVSETGVVAEVSRGGVSSRVGRGRADAVHHLLDPVLVVGPWVVAAGLGVKGVRVVVRAVRG